MGLVVLLLSACSSITSKSKLSEMEDNELIQYMIDSGVSIPENMQVYAIREMIIELEKDPEHSPPVVGWTVITDLYEEIRRVVKNYSADS